MVPLDRARNSMQNCCPVPSRMSRPSRPSCPSSNPQIHTFDTKLIHGNTIKYIKLQDDMTRIQCHLRISIIHYSFHIMDSSIRHCLQDFSIRIMVSASELHYDWNQKLPIVQKSEASLGRTHTQRTLWSNFPLARSNIHHTIPP